MCIKCASTINLFVNFEVKLKANQVILEVEICKTKEVTPRCKQLTIGAQTLTINNASTVAGWAPTHLVMANLSSWHHRKLFLPCGWWFFEYSKGCCNAHLLNAKLFLLSIPLPGYGVFKTPAGLWCQLGDWNVSPQRFAPNFSFDLGMKFQHVPYMFRLRHFAIEHLKMRISLTSWARKSCKRFIISPFIRPKIPKLGKSLPGHKRNSLISFSNHSSHGITAWEMSKKQVPKVSVQLNLVFESLPNWSLINPHGSERSQ